MVDASVVKSTVDKMIKMLEDAQLIHVATFSFFRLMELAKVVVHISTNSLTKRAVSNEFAS